MSESDKKVNYEDLRKEIHDSYEEVSKEVSDSYEEVSILSEQMNKSFDKLDSGLEEMVLDLKTINDYLNRSYKTRK